MERHYFAGGNTRDGFVDLYKYVIDRKACNKFFIIKGGSGVGKSTMLKKFAAAVGSYLKTVEFFHCSADIDSLDGVAFRELGVALVDGTAPHVVEPVYVKAGDKAVDLAVYLNAEKLCDKKAELISIMDEKAAHYKHAYELIKSMGSIYQSIYECIGNDIDARALSNVSDELKDRVSSKGRGKRRALFAGAYTSLGEVYLEEKADKLKVVRLSGNVYVAAHVLSELYKKLSDGLHDLTLFYSPISTDYLYGLEVDNKILFTINDKIKSKDCVEFDSGARLKLSGNARTYADTLGAHLDAVENSACDCLKSAKLCHDKIEAIYKPAVDFNKVDKETDEIISEIKTLI